MKQERYLRGEIHSEIFLADIKNMEMCLQFRVLRKAAKMELSKGTPLK